MAQTSKSAAAPSLPRLLALDEDFQGLDEKITNAAKICGLQDGCAVEPEKQYTYARAEWVLRWLLNKFKQQDDPSISVRANARAWKLAARALNVLPISRAAATLRDADFITILERTLCENFQHDETVSHDALDGNNDFSESSSTVDETPKSSRKRKRPSSGTNTPSKRARPDISNRNLLFDGIHEVLQTIVHKTNLNEDLNDRVASEHMKMVLRTESSQAARVLKFWLTATHASLKGELRKSRSVFHKIQILSKVTLALDIWEYREVDISDDSTASAELFSTECLVPALSLFDLIKRCNAAEDKSVAAARKHVLRSLERLFVAHLIVPSRVAFFADAASGEKPTPNASRAEAVFLNNCLAPLRASIQQAASASRALGHLPQTGAALFHSITYLMSLILRLSLRGTLKRKNTETPWIQAAFIAFLECSGATLEQLDVPVTTPTIETIGSLVSELTDKAIRIDSTIVEDIFWYHSGINGESPQGVPVHWSLIAKLITFDPVLFLPKPKSNAQEGDRPQDLSTLLFDRISTTQTDDFGASDNDQNARPAHQHQVAETIYGSDRPNLPSKADLLQSVMVPLMKAFARNRDLLGFISRWDAQLHKSAKIVQDWKYGPESDNHPSIWEDETISTELGKVLETSLTVSQIAKLFNEHVFCVSGLLEVVQANTSGRYKSRSEKEAFRNSCSSTIILSVLLDCMSSDELIESVKSDLSSLLSKFDSLLQHELYCSTADLAITWSTLSRLVDLLWPVQLHDSNEEQQKFLDSSAIMIAYQKIVALRKEPLDSNKAFARLAAFAFLLTAWDRLRTIPEREALVREHLQKTVSSLIPAFDASRGKSSLKHSESRRHAREIEMLLGRFPDLLHYLPSHARKMIFKSLYLSDRNKPVPEFDDRLRNSCVGCFLCSPHPDIRQDFSDVLHGTMESNEDPTAIVSAENAYLHVPVAVFSRQRRETALDRITDIIVSSKELDKDVIVSSLAVIMHFMQVPNATSSICVDASIIFKVATRIDKHNLALDLVIRNMFEVIVQRILNHALAEKEQTRNKKFLKQFKKKLESLGAKNPNLDEDYAMELLLTKAAAKADDSLVNIDRYLELLDVGGQHSESAGSDALFELQLDALSEVPETAKQKTRLIASAEERAKTADGQTSIAALRLRVQYPTLGSEEAIMRSALNILQRPDLSAKDHLTIAQAFRQVISHLAMPKKLNLVQGFLETGTADAAQLQLAHTVISTIEGKEVETDDSDETHRKKELLGILPHLCDLISQTSKPACFNALLDSINTIVYKKPFMTSQYGIECVLAALTIIASPTGPAIPTIHAPAIYTRLCETTHHLLSLYRARLGGRFHLLLPLLQSLLWCLYLPNPGRTHQHPPWLQTSSTALTPANAKPFTRLLSTLCSPTISAVTGGRHHHQSMHLVDQIKKARTYASQYVPSFLGWFCRCQLNGRLDPTVRERLLPGLWAVMDCAALDMDGLKGMNAGLDGATRGIWKGIWSEWSKATGRNP